MLQLSDDEHADDELLSSQGILICIYWRLIGCGLMNIQPLAGKWQLISITLILLEKYEAIKE